MPERPARLGFTLVELVVVVMLLGILAGVAAPKLLGVSQQSEAAVVLTNIEIIFDAAERFAADHGRLPDNSDMGVFPTDLEGYLNESLFTEPSPFGDPYDWNGPGTGRPSYGVSIHVPDGPEPFYRNVYKEIELLADDGSPTTGWITIRGRTIDFELQDK